MQVDLSQGGPHEVFGTLGTAEGRELVERSFFSAERAYYDGKEHILPQSLVSQSGRHELAFATDSQDESKVRLIIAATGRATFVTRLDDGTGIVTNSAISQTNRAVFFKPLYPGRVGSFGGEVSLSDLLVNEPSVDQPFWWAQPNQPWKNLSLRKPTPLNP